MKLPALLSEAGFLANRGSWDVFTLRATPHHLVEKVQFVWKLSDIANRSDSRKAGKKKAKG